MNVPDNEFFQALGRLEGTMRAVEQKLDAYLEQGTELEKRVRSLENWRWMLLGGMAVVGALGGIVLNIVVK